MNPPAPPALAFLRRGRLDRRRAIGLLVAPLPTAAVDIDVLKALVGDDQETVRELLADYRTSAGRLADDIRHAHDSRDVRQIASIAHTLKGSSRSIGALALGDVCAELENACRADAWEGVSQSTLKFEAELVDVNACVDQLLAEV